MNNEEVQKETVNAETPKAEAPKSETPVETKKTNWFKKIFWSKGAKITYGVLGLGAIGAGAALWYTREAAAQPEA